MKKALMVVLALTPMAVFASKRPILRVPEPAAGKYLVVLNDTVPIDQIQRIADRLSQVYGGSRHSVYTRAFRGFSITMPDDLAQKLNGDDLVFSVEEVGEVHLSEDSPAGHKIDREQAPSGDHRKADTVDRRPKPLIDDPDAVVLSTTAWQLDRIDQRNILSSPGPDYTYRYHVTVSGSGVDAYILDTGVWPGHEQLTGRVAAGANFVTGEANNPCAWGSPGNNPWCGLPANPTSDQLLTAGHGTAVASALGGATIGVAPRVTIVPVRVVSSAGQPGDTTVVADGIEWILQQREAQRQTNSLRPAVANCSWWTIPPPDPSAIDQAITNLINDGVFVAVSANNYKNYEDLKSRTKDYSACGQTPARVPAAVTVGGTDRYDGIWAGSDNIAVPRGTWQSGSNTGPCVDIFAPAEHLKVAHIASASAYRDGENSSGTSFASPQVAGVAATYLQNDHVASAATVWSFIQANATVGKIVPADPNNPLAISRTYTDSYGVQFTEYAPNRLLYSDIAPIKTISPTIRVRVSAFRTTRYNGRKLPAGFHIHFRKYGNISARISGAHKIQL